MSGWTVKTSHCLLLRNWSVDLSRINATSWRGWWREERKEKGGEGKRSKEKAIGDEERLRMWEEIRWRKQQGGGNKLGKHGEGLLNDIYSYKRGGDKDWTRRYWRWRAETNETEWEKKYRKNKWDNWMKEKGRWSIRRNGREKGCIKLGEKVEKRGDWIKEKILYIL